MLATTRTAKTTFPTTASQLSSSYPAGLVMSLTWKNRDVPV